jgi:acetyl-CoA carboxylase biotin carboxyl carrier protein
MANPKAPFDTDVIRELAELVSKTDLHEIEVEKGDLKIRVARHRPETIHVQSAPVAYATAPAPTAPVAVAAPAVMGAAAPAKAEKHPGAVPSPMVGTAYRSPNPDSKPFVEVGSVVKAGEKILLIEAMKTFNDIVAPRAGTVTAIFVEDRQPVEYGEALLVIE